MEDPIRSSQHFKEVLRRRNINLVPTFLSVEVIYENMDLNKYGPKYEYGPKWVKRIECC